MAIQADNDTPSFSPSGLAILDPGSSLQTAASQRSQDLAQALGAMGGPATDIRMPADPAIDGLVYALMQRTYGQPTQDLGQAPYGAGYASLGYPGLASTDQTFDGLVPALQTGLSQDRAVNFDDLVPNQGAPWPPSSWGAGAIDFGQPIGGAAAAGATQPNPRAGTPPADVTGAGRAPSRPSPNGPSDGTANHAPSPDNSGGMTLGKDGSSRTVATTKPDVGTPDYGGFDEFYTNWSKSHKGAPRYIPESQWNPYPPISVRMTPESDLGPYRMITFHHTGSEDTPMSVADFDRGKENLLHLLGREAVNGFNAPSYSDNGDVSYHFMIDKGGTIYGGRSLAYQGAHVYGHNPGNVGVAFIGDYSSQPLSDAQVYAAKSLIHALNDAYGVYSRAGGAQYVFTHRDLAPAMGPHARPTELLGAQRQMDAVKAWSIKTLPADH